MHTHTHEQQQERQDEHESKASGKPKLAAARRPCTCVRSCARRDVCRVRQLCLPAVACLVRCGRGRDGCLLASTSASSARQHASERQMACTKPNHARCLVLLSPYALGLNLPSPLSMRDTASDCATNGDEPSAAACTEPRRDTSTDELDMAGRATRGCRKGV